MIIENSISWLINYFRNNHYIFHTIYVENDLYHCKKIALLLDNAIKYSESASKPCEISFNVENNFFIERLAMQQGAGHGAKTYTEKILLLLNREDDPAAVVGRLMLTEAVFGPLWAWFFINEIPPTSVIIGGSIIISSILFEFFFSRKKK